MVEKFIVPAKLWESFLDANSRFGSFCEFPLLAKNSLKLPGKFQDRDDCPRMAGRGWIAEWRLWRSDREELAQCWLEFRARAEQSLAIA